MKFFAYSGTGTYGKDNARSFTTDFPIKMIIYIGAYETAFNEFSGANGGQIPSNILSSTYKRISFINTTQSGYEQYSKINTNNTVFSFYGTGNVYTALNNTGYTYHFLCIG